MLVCDLSKTYNLDHLFEIIGHNRRARKHQQPITFIVYSFTVNIEYWRLRNLGIQNCKPTKIKNMFFVCFGGKWVTLILR